VQRLRYLQRLCIISAAIPQELRNHYAAIAQRYSTIAQPDSVAISVPCRNSTAILVQEIRSNHAAIANRLRSDSVAIAQRLQTDCGDSTVNPQ
jgi:hypothetical protein